MKAFFTLWLLCVGAAVNAQVKIKGMVTDHKGKPIAGVSVSIKDSYDGATTDTTGNYAFETEEKGEKLLDFSTTEYLPVAKTIVIENKELIINVILKERITELNAVILTAGTFEASDKKKGTVLSSLDVVTTAGSNGDVTGALNTLPGTQQVGESEGLFVRGGSATESKIFIDGALVNNFFYSSKPGIASRGRFNPFIFKGTQFSTGGYSALYGQALSSALILESNDLAEQTEGSLSLSIVGIGAGIQRLAKDKKSSWGAVYGYANLRPAFQLMRQKQDFTTYPVYHDGDFNFRIKKGGLLLKYYGYGSWNKLGFTEADIDSVQLRNHFGLANTNTYQNLSTRINMNKGWKNYTVLSFGTNKDDIDNELQDVQGKKQLFYSPAGYQLKNYTVGTKQLFAQARTVFEKRLQGLSAIRFGTEHFYSKEKSVYTAFNGQQFSNNIVENLTAAFGEYDVYITKDIAAKAGLRAEHSTLLDKWNLAPRASVAYKLATGSQLSFAYGIFYQNPETRYLPAFNSVGFSKSTHYMLQYQRYVGGRLLRSEIFYKDYNNLYKTTYSAFGTPSVKDNKGSGYAKGLEIFWRDKKSIKLIDYWVSYSYLDTKRDYLNYPNAIVPHFAAKHTASLVLKSFFVKMKTGFNLSHTFASGRPYYQMVYNPASGKEAIGDNGITKSYNNLSFNVNYLPWLGQKSKKAFSVLVLMVNNIARFNNVFGYNYGSINPNKVPVTPTGKRFVFVGWFMTFGVDRTQDAINNNL